MISILLSTIDRRRRRLRVAFVPSLIVAVLGSTLVLPQTVRAQTNDGSACVAGGEHAARVFDLRGTEPRSPFDGRRGLLFLVAPGLGGDLSSVPYPRTPDVVTINDVGLPGRSAVGVGFEAGPTGASRWRAVRAPSGDLYLEVFSLAGDLPRRLVTSVVGANGCPLVSARTVFTIALPASTPPTTTVPPSGSATTLAPGDDGCAAVVSGARVGIDGSRRFGLNPSEVASRFAVGDSCDANVDQFVVLDGTILRTCDDAAGLVLIWLERLESESEVLGRDLGQEFVPLDLAAASSVGQALYAEWDDKREPLDEQDLDRLAVWRDRALRIVNAMQVTALDQAALRVQRAAALAAKARQNAFDLAPTIKEERRRAFAAGEPSRLVTLAEQLKEVDTFLAEAQGYVDKAASVISFLKSKKVPGADQLVNATESVSKILGNFGKFSALMDRLQSVKPLFELANTAKTDVNRLADVANAQATFAGLFASIGGYGPLTAHFGPIMEKITANLAVISEATLNKNRDWIRFRDNPNLADFSNFEGGRPMYDYLASVMRYKSGNLPGLTAGVRDYLRAKDDELVTARNLFGIVDSTSLPSGTDTLTRWILDHRADIWVYFYGSLPTPRDSAP